MADLQYTNKDDATAAANRNKRALDKVKQAGEAIAMRTLSFVGTNAGSIAAGAAIAWKPSLGGTQATLPLIFGPIIGMVGVSGVFGKASEAITGFGAGLSGGDLSIRTWGALSAARARKQGNAPPK